MAGRRPSSCAMAARTRRRASSAPGRRSARSRWEATYQVAWKNGAADQYLAWTVDGSGNFITQGGMVAGSTWYVQSFESTVHQDLNGDGTIGPVTTVIEASGATILTQVADSYLRELWRAVGPSRSTMAARTQAASQFGGWTAIGAEQSVGGYEVVWQNGAATIRCGTLTAPATTARRAPSSTGTAQRSQRSKPVSSKTSTMTARSPHDSGRSGWIDHPRQVGERLLPGCGRWVVGPPAEL